MSLATSFLYHRPFPFCVERKTEGELAAMAAGGASQQYVRIGGLSAAEAQAIFWNLETMTVDLAHTTGGSYGMTLSHTGFGEPRTRKCYEPGGIDHFGLLIGSDGAPGGFSGFVAYLTFDDPVPGLYYNTTADAYEYLLNIGLSFGPGGETVSLFSAYDSGDITDEGGGDYAGYTGNSSTVTIFGRSVTLYEYTQDVRTGNTLSASGWAQQVYTYPP